MFYFSQSWWVVFVSFPEIIDKWINNCGSSSITPGIAYFFA